MTVTSHSALARQDALRQIELKIKLKLDGLIAGEHQGLLPGLGSELGETRPYQAGDDVRRIDWNVSARLGSVYTRGTIIDHELDTWLVAGISARTWFGTSQYLKSELTLAAVATFGQLGLRMKSRVGAIVAGPKNLKSHRPSKTRGQLHKILTSIDEARPADGTGPADLLQGLTELRKLTSRRSLIVIVSDFVAPIPNEPSRSDCGTAVITSSDSDETKGIIMIPMTKPAANALSEATVKPMASPSSRINGATVSAAKNP